MKKEKIQITFKNNFVRIVEKSSIRNFNSLIDWMNMFNNGQHVSLLTISGRDLGSTISLDKNNIKSINFII